MPLLLVIPMVAFVLIVGGVRGRRSAANIGLIATVLTLLDAALVTWARYRTGKPFTASYQYLNVPVAFQGDQRFQVFGVNLVFLIDHYTLAAAFAVLLVFLGCLAWHRIQGRAEVGPVRYQANAMLLLLSALGVLVSGDLVELLAFWMAGGIASYLLLAHRWGSDSAGRSSRVALSLPFAGDVALLAAVSLLYSRFGSLTVDSIAAALHTTPGVGARSVTAAAALLFVAVAVRAAIWPFTAWQTGPVEAPASLSALIAGVWPVLAGMTLLRVLPIVTGASGGAPQAAVVWLGVAGVAGPLLSLLQRDLRRAILLAGSGAVALGLLGVFQSGSAPAGFTALLGVGAARAGVLLGAGSIVIALRTADLTSTGEGWRRLRWSTLGLTGALVALSFAACAAAALRPESVPALAWAPALVAIGAALGRIYGAVAHGRLPPRRAFEPDRVRDATTAPVAAAAGLALAGLVALALPHFDRWAGFLGAHVKVPPASDATLWLLPAAIGAAAGAGLLITSRAATEAWLERPARAYVRLVAAARTGYGRYVARPLLAAVRAVEATAIPGAEGGIGQGLLGTGALIDRALPWAAAALALVVLVIAFALTAPGGGR